MPETLLYEGKAKRVFATDDEAVLLHRYKDDATAFNAKKRGSWEGKGKTNATMSAALFKYLESRGLWSEVEESHTHERAATIVREVTRTALEVPKPSPS